MWHEARKQEKKLRVMIVDYRKRAERRREFYEKFKADPTQFMQVHGRPSKIYLEPQIAASAENCMVPWQGNADNMIDRFDVRANLDLIPDWHGSSSKNLAQEEEEANPGINYERYRILIQNDLSGTSEDKFLHQIHLEEQFGTSATNHPHFYGKPLPPKAPKAAIGYNYEDSTPAFSTQPVNKPPPAGEEDEESEEEIDFDLLVNLDDLTHGQKAELNNHGTKYGLGIGDFMDYLTADFEEKEKMRLAKLQEEEKQAMSGRKARRERRAYKDKLILKKGYVSPPSYATYVAAGDEDPVDLRRSSSRSESRSRSASPEKITFITSFGGNESDDEGGKGGSPNKGFTSGGRKPVSLEGSHHHSFTTSGGNSATQVFGPSFPSGDRKPGGGDSKRHGRRRRSRSRSRSTGRSRRRSRSRSRSRSRRRSRRRSDSRGRRRRRSSSSSSRSRSRSHSRKRRRHYRRRSSSSRSRSPSRSRRRRRSRSRSRSRGGARRRSRSRSRSRHRRRSRSRSRSRRSRSRSNSRRRIRSRRSRSRSSTSSSSSGTSSPAKSSSTKSSKRKRSRSSSSSSRSPVRRKSVEPQITTNTKSENGSELPAVVSLPTVSTTTTIKEPTPPPPPPVRRYYGRHLKSKSPDSSGTSSSDDDSDDGSGGQQNGSQSQKRDSDGSQQPKGKTGLSSASKEDMTSSSNTGGGSGLGCKSHSSFSSNNSSSAIASSSSSASMAKLTPKERLRRKMQSALSKTFKADKEAEKVRQEKQHQERLEREESLRELTIKYRRREREKRHRDRDMDRSSSSSGRSSRSLSRSPRRSRSRSNSPY